MMGRPCREERNESRNGVRERLLTAVRARSDVSLQDHEKTVSFIARPYGLRRCCRSPEAPEDGDDVLCEVEHELALRNLLGVLLDIHRGGREDAIKSARDL